MILRNPCKVCIVQAACREECLDKLTYKRNEPWRSGIVIMLEIVISAIVIVFSKHFLSIKFPVLNHDFFEMTYYLLGIAISSYLIFRETHRQYMRDRKELFRE